MIALPWKKLCANFILPCGENHYGFFLRCPTSFYNQPKLKIETITEKEIENLHNSSNTEETVEEILKIRGCNLKMPLLDVFCNGLKAKIDDLRKGLAVVCFTEDVKSILMWSHYANNHRGFCIEYKLAQTDLSKQIRKVIYSSERHYLRDEDLKEKGIFGSTL